MKLYEKRSEPRFPIKAGFVEIDDVPYELDDLSENGLGVISNNPHRFSVDSVLEAFLVLQEADEMYEMPVSLTVRRVAGTHIGCRMNYRFPNHRDTVRQFINSPDD